MTVATTGCNGLQCCITIWLLVGECTNFEFGVKVALVHKMAARTVPRDS